MLWWIKVFDTLLYLSIFPIFMIKRIIILFFSIALIAGVPLVSRARGGDVFISAEEQVAGDVVRGGRAVKVLAPVDGNVVVAGANVVIEGPVSGNVVVMGGEVHLSTDVQGSVIALGGTIEIDGTVKGSVIAAGGRITMHESSDIGGSVIAASSELVLRGRVGKDVRFYGDAFEFGGEVQRNMHIMVPDGDRITLERTAVIGGDFEYTSQSPAQLHEGSMVKGSTQHHQMEVPSARARVGSLALGRLIAMFSLIVVGLVLVSIIPKAIDEITATDYFWKWRNAGEGVTWLIIAPIAALVLIFTVIGVPFAVILGALWAVAVYCAQVIIAIALGKKVLVDMLKAGEPSRFVQLAFGSLIWVVLIHIPIVGVACGIAGTTLGLGSMISFKRKELARYR